MLSHVEIYVSDLVKTHAFWSWVFAQIGWQPYQSFDGGFSYKHDGSYIVFVQAQEKHLDAGYHRGRVGLNHLAFAAPDRDSVDKLTAALGEKNIPLLYAGRHPDPQHAAYAAYFEDPDRIKVEYTVKVAPL